MSSATELISQATAENLWNALKEAGWYRYEDVNNGSTKGLQEEGGNLSSINNMDPEGNAIIIRLQADLS